MPNTAAITETGAQRRLFERLRDLLPTNQNLADEVAEVLGVSADSAYRRIRGEKPLSLAETVKLCGKFRMSVDALMGQEASTVAFHYNRLANGEEFESYLEGMANLLGQMTQVPKSSIIYGASDIAIFHYFGRPEHAAFKLFYWQQAILGLPELQGIKFSPERVSAKAMTLAKSIYDRYASVPSIEIWTVNSALTSVRQVAYYYDMGLFETDALAREVADQLAHALANVARMAESDGKDLLGKVPFKLYESEMQIGNNTVLAQVGDTRVTYVSHQTFNVITTFNAAFCDDTEQFLKGLIRKSMLISGVSERQRRQFFQRLTAPVAELRARMG